jgi:3-oxoacyl-[acyl-carrier protein] reductase
MNLGLKNKNVLITGSSRGIGYAIAEAFLKEGAKVMLISRGENQLKKALNSLRETYGDSYVESQVCDCSKENELILMSQQISKKWKQIDIVVANVGDGQSVSDAIPSATHWNKIWDTNFNSALYVSRVFMPFLMKSKGSLLFISSIAAIEAFGAPVDYSTAKSAIVAFSKNLSRKVAEDFRVNVIAPGNIFFPGGSWDKKMKRDPKKTMENISSSVPMKRFGMPSEIADAAVFISSDCAKFITGSILVIDGGQTLRI